MGSTSDATLRLADRHIIQFLKDKLRFEFVIRIAGDLLAATATKSTGIVLSESVFLDLPRLQETCILQMIIYPERYFAFTVVDSIAQRVYP